MKQIIIIMSLVSTIFSVRAQQKTVVKLLTPIEFKEQVENKDVQLIDVRTPQEFDLRHIKGAINIDIYSESFISEFDKLDKSKPIYVYCRSGIRSNQAVIKLADLGFKEIFDLKGGILKFK